MKHSIAPWLLAAGLVIGAGCQSAATDSWGLTRNTDRMSKDDAALLPFKGDLFQDGGTWDNRPGHLPQEVCVPKPDVPRIAVLGAGPVGLEAALYARALSLPVAVYERGRVAEHV